jgi:hypothetical protein
MTTSSLQELHHGAHLSYYLLMLKTSLLLYYASVIVAGTVCIHLNATILSSRRIAIIVE